MCVAKNEGIKHKKKRWIVKHNRRTISKWAKHTDKDRSKHSKNTRNRVPCSVRTMGDLCVRIISHEKDSLCSSQDEEDPLFLFLLFLLFCPVFYPGMNVVCVLTECSCLTLSFSLLDPLDCIILWTFPYSSSLLPSTLLVLVELDSCLRVTSLSGPLGLVLLILFLWVSLMFISSLSLDRLRRERQSITAAVKART